MSLFFESIKLQNGIPKHLSYHQARVDRTYHNYWGTDTKLDLSSLIHNTPRQTSAVLAKCKIIYDKNGVLSITDSIYHPKTIKNLKITEIKTHERYPYKHLDRSWIDAYTQDLPPDTDTLFIRDGLVLESSYTNVALLKNNKWYTPSNPLHKGTTLERFVLSGHLIPSEIPVHALDDYKELRLFNAILGWRLGHSFLYSQLMF